MLFSKFKIFKAFLSNKISTLWLWHYFYLLQSFSCEIFFVIHIFFTIFRFTWLHSTSSKWTHHYWVSSWQWISRFKIGLPISWISWLYEFRGKWFSPDAQKQIHARTLRSYLVQVPGRLEENSWWKFSSKLERKERNQRYHQKQ